MSVEEGKWKGLKLFFLIQWNDAMGVEGRRSRRGYYAIENALMDIVKLLNGFRSSSSITPIGFPCFFHDTHMDGNGLWDEMWWVMAGTWCSLLCGDKLMCGSCSRWMDGLMDMNSPHPLLLLLRYSSIIIQEPFVLWDSYGTTTIQSKRTMAGSVNRMNWINRWAFSFACLTKLKLIYLIPLCPSFVQFIYA